MAAASSPSSAELISEALRDVEPESAKVKATYTGSVVGGADSLLPIVSSQRERFKQRNIELEAVSRGKKSEPYWLICSACGETSLIQI